jgi:threonine/homoserine/homoserine lactone efflux protein
MCPKKPPTSNTSTLRGIYLQGILIALLNPKVAMFFLAFLPQFVVQGAGPVPAQLFLHGCLVITVAAFIEPVIILSGDRLTRTLRSNRQLSVWLDRTLGALLIALGVRLAFQQR